MGSGSQRASAAERARATAAAIVCILLLMWPALVNRQPFFFSDTTSYIRAADLAVKLASGGAVSTIWSQPRAAPAAPAATPGTSIAAPGLSADPAIVRGNDVASGFIMTGRSPYFGALLWLSYVVSDFWLFVILQAVVAYLLIGMALRCFGLDRPGPKIAAVSALSLATPLAIYNGMLLADALAGFGILAFLILAASWRVRLARWERVLLVAIVLFSAVSHLTHIVMLVAMTALLVLSMAIERPPRRRLAGPILIGAVGVAVGLASVMMTSWVVQACFGKPPVLVPLITARFIADGPGRDFIRDGCGGHRFAACAVPYRGWTSSTDFLWSRDPAHGAFLLADAPTRRRMSLEDMAFARAVAWAYPIRTVGLAAWNSLLQIANFKTDILDERCFADPACTGGQFPETIARRIGASPAGQGRWPAAPLTFIAYAAVIASLAALAVLLPGLRRIDRESARLIALWLALLALAMAANAFLGGAISEPQSRYQARIIWLLPLLALITLFLRARRGRPTPA